MTSPCAKPLRPMDLWTVHGSSTIVKLEGLVVLGLLKCPTKKKLKLHSTAWKAKTCWGAPFVATKASHASVADADNA